jgi:hypothetical protein
VTRSHKWTDRDHAGIADGSAERESRLPRYFAKSGHADTDPTKTKKDGSGKGNWYVKSISQSVDCFHGVTLRPFSLARH